MVIVTIILAFALIFLSGVHWCAYKVDTIEERPKARNSLLWSIACGIIGVYHLISLVGLSAKY